MGSRGKQSAEALATVSPVRIEVRPDAPYDLPDEAAQVWKATLEALPASWIGPEAHPVLAAYCRTTVALRRLGQLIHQAEYAEGPLDVDLHGKLLRSHASQSGVLKNLATALRLTPQTRMRAEKAGRAGRGGTGPRPWEYKGGE